MKINASILRCSASPIFRLARKVMLYTFLLGVNSALCLRAGFLANPSFESNFNDTWPHYGSVDGWVGANGVNEVAGPFHNSQTAIPDQARAAFNQGAGTLGQDIANLTPGQQYWVQFYYDARSGSQKVDITVSFNGIDVGKLANVQPSYTKNSPYYFASFPFTPDVDAGQLLFTVAVIGDSTAMFDAVSIVPRDTGNVTMANPSFEASGDTPDDGFMAGGLAGWTATGRYGVNKTDGTGTYANNGTPFDQDHVVVLNSVSSISQTVNGITPGKPYQLTFAYNASTGNTPHMQVKAGETVIYEENVTAVGGAKAYRTKTVTFTATDFSAPITFGQTMAGDQTLLLDDIKLLGEAAKPLPPLVITPSVAEISPGQKLTVSVAVPDLLLMTRDINITLKSLTPSVARLTGVNSDGIVALHYAKGGSSSQPLELQGIARGSALLDVVSNDGLTVSDTLMTYVVTSFVKNPSFDSTAAPAGTGAGDILGWTGGSGVDTAGMPFFDNGLVPDRKQVGYIQGAKTLSQQITGLTPSANYWLQFYYNARQFGTDWKLDLSVKFAGQEIAQINDIQAVGADMPFNFKNAGFKPATDSGLLEFVTTVTGDATLLLDAISIVNRDPSDLVVINPSFEASGTIVGGVGYLTDNPLAGWTFAASGYGINVLSRDPFADNGVNPDQDSVAFIQNAGSMSQTLTGLTAGKKYTAIMWVDPRNCCSGVIETTLRVSFEETVVLEEIIQPVLGSNPYLVKEVVFTASGTEGVLKIEHAPEVGTDRSLAIDNVRVVPEGQIPPIILTEPQSAGNLLRGDSASLSVSAMGKEPLTYQWQFNGKDLMGKTATNLDLTSLTVDQSGAYTVVVKNSVGQKTSRIATVQVYEKVPGGFNSGVTATGTLGDPGSVDPYFVLVVNPNDGTSTKAYVVSYPTDGWVTNTESSQWIGPVPNPQSVPMPSIGFYTYRLMFNLTGYDPANTFITANTAAYEGVHDIYINDILAPGNRRASASGSFAPFTLTSGFKAGLNTLDIMVLSADSQKPTGLQVQGMKIGAKVAINTAPVLIEITNRTVMVGDEMVVTLDGRDRDLPPNHLTYSLVTSPSSAVINGNVLRWTPSVTDGDSRPMFTVQVTDDVGASDRTSFTVTVTKLGPVQSYYTEIGSLPAPTAAERGEVFDSATGTLFSFIYWSHAGAGGNSHDVYSTKVEGDVFSWNKTSSTPGENYWGRGCASGRLYFNGTIHGAVNSWFAPIIAGGMLGSWQGAAALPSINGARSLHQTFIFGSKLYVIGGWHGDGQPAYADAYYAPIQSDGALGTFVQTTSLPQGVVGHSAAVSMDGRIYVAAGANLYFAQIIADGSIGNWLTQPTVTEMNHNNLGNIGMGLAGNRLVIVDYTNTFVCHLNTMGQFDALIATIKNPAYLGERSVYTYNGKVYVTSTTGKIYRIDGLTTASVIPTITLEPRNQTVTVGANVTFTVEASGTMPLTYQWKYNGTVIIDATSPSLTVSDVRGTNSGSYTVDIGNAVGMVTSNGGLLLVNEVQATPILAWTAPTDIVYGTALSSAQLNASANVNGTFTYSPASGTILKAGSGQILSVKFTPTDTVNYSTATKTVSVNVLKAPPVLSAIPDRTIVAGEEMLITLDGHQGDLLPNLLTYWLVKGPSNATVSADGQLRWTPVIAQSPSTNIFRVVVSDGSLSTTNAFSVEVIDLVTYIGSAEVFNKVNSLPPVTVSIRNGSRPDWLVFYSLDGTTPTDSSYYYVESFTLKQSSTVWPVLYSPDFSQWIVGLPVRVNVLKAQTLNVSVEGGLIYQGPAVAVNATASSGLPVSLEVIGGPGRLESNNLVPTGGGMVAVRATQEGDEVWGVVSVTNTFTVSPAAQTIRWTAVPEQTYGAGPVTLNATASSELPVIFQVASGPGTVSGNQLTLTGGGSIVVKALQLGTADYQPTTSDISVVVAKASQTLIFAALPNQAYTIAPIALVANASSKLTVSFEVLVGPATVNESQLTLTGVGTVLVRAMQAGDANFNAATPKDQTFTVSKGAQTITFTPVGAKTFNDPPVTLNATSSAELPLTFQVISGPGVVNGNKLSLIGAGSVVVQAAQAGNDFYSPATAIQTVVVGKAAQTLTFGALANIGYTTNAIALVGTASSALPVSFRMVSGPATVAGNNLRLTGIGTVAVAAEQTGDSNYLAAASVTNTFTVSRGAQTIAFTTIGDQVLGNAPISLQASSSANLAVVFTVLSGPATLSGSQLTLVNEGTVVVRALNPGSSLYLAAQAEQTFSIRKMTTLTVTVAGGLGGTVSVDPLKDLYAPRDTVTLSALPVNGFEFTGWSGDLSGSQNPTVLAMSSSHRVTATFRDAKDPLITIVEPVSGSTQNEQTTLRGTVTDNVGVSSSQWLRDGAVKNALVLAADGSFQVGGLVLNRGVNVFDVIASDAAGNSSTQRVEVTWAPSRTLYVINPSEVQEGKRVTVPIILASQGDVGGMSFAVKYDTNYLREPELTWSGDASASLNQVNYDAMGLIRANFALPVTGVSAGTSQVAQVSFRARSVPFELDSGIELEVNDVSLPSGEQVAYGTDTQAGRVHILKRRFTGDNNANDRLDIGDATIIQRLIAGLEEVRNWDVGLNDLNASGAMDSGDVIKVLRTVVGIDAQPTPKLVGLSSVPVIKLMSIGRHVLSLAKPADEAAVLSPSLLTGNAGQMVTMQVVLTNTVGSLSGASFMLDYPTNAIRLLNAQSHKAGALVPLSGAIVVWNVAPAQTDYAQQSGRISFAASSATTWTTNQGMLAEFAFQVQAGAAIQSSWPIILSKVEVTGNGFEVRTLPDALASFGKQAASLPPEFVDGSSDYSKTGFSFMIEGQPGDRYRIETSTTLTNWSILTTITNTSGSVQFTDSSAITQTKRFYRAVVNP